MRFSRASAFRFFVFRDVVCLPVGRGVGGCAWVTSARVGARVGVVTIARGDDVAGLSAIVGRAI